MAERVGPAGHVLATDIDVDWIGADLPAGVEVGQHDVARNEPPGGGLDLVRHLLGLGNPMTPCPASAAPVS